MRERPAEARPVILSELQQILDKGVWHGVKLSHLSHPERKAIIRSSMFLKDKYFASRVFEKFKARLVAGEDQQGKGLYENLSSPTAATSSVKGRNVITIDIGGAFLNADIAPTGVKVHMHLDRMMTQLLIEINTGCVLGDAEALFAKSSKQKIVTKSCKEAELVGLSDTRVTFFK